MVFHIEIAEILVEIHSIYNKVFEYCKDYIVNPTKTPDIVIRISEEDIAKEKDITALNERNRSTKTQRSNAVLESSVVHRKIADALLPYRRFVMHGTVVAFSNRDNDDEAVIFTARSGEGKTTHAQLWINNIDNSYILNGDKPIIRVEENGVYAYGSPWQGKERQGCNKKAKINAICFLTRSDENILITEQADDIFIRLLNQCHRPKNKNSMCILLNLVEHVKCDFYTLKCNNFKENAFSVASSIIYT